MNFKLRRRIFIPRPRNLFCNMAMVTIANVKQSNGVIHVIDKVLMPN